MGDKLRAVSDDGDGDGTSHGEGAFSDKLREAPGQLGEEEGEDGRPGLARIRGGGQGFVIRGFTGGEG